MLATEGCASARAQYSVLGDQRGALQASLKDRGVPTAVYAIQCPSTCQRPSLRSAMHQVCVRADLRPANPSVSRNGHARSYRIRGTGGSPLTITGKRLPITARLTSGGICAIEVCRWGVRIEYRRATPVSRMVNSGRGGNARSYVEADPKCRAF